MRQGSLFDLLPPDNPDEAIGLAGMMPAIRAEMNRVAAAYEPGRKLLVDAVTKVAQREAVALTSGGAKALDPAVLDKWLQPSDRGHAPNIDAVICFCLATGNASPIRPILKALGLVAILESELEDLEYGKICIAQRELRERKLALQARRKRCHLNSADSLAHFALRSATSYGMRCACAGIRAVLWPGRLAAAM